MLNWKVNQQDLSDIESIDSEEENEPTISDQGSNEDPEEIENRKAREELKKNLQKLKENAKAISVA